MSQLQMNFVEKQKQLANDQVLKDVGHFHDGIVTQFKKEHNKLPERFFVTMFLPYFSGQKKIEKDSDVLAKWFSIAGSHSAEVTIIDNNTSAPLFDVPAVHPRSRINSAYNTQRTMMSIEDVAVMAEKLNATLPGRANQFVADAYGSRLKALLDKNNPIAQEAMSDTDKDILRWNEIFERYGLVTKAPAAASVSNTSVIPDDDMYFE